MARATLCNCLRILLLALISSIGHVEARPVSDPAHSTLSLQLGLNSGSPMEPHSQAASNIRNFRVSPSNDVDLELGLSLRPSQFRAMPKQGAPNIDPTLTFTHDSSHQTQTTALSHHLDKGKAVVVPEVKLSQPAPATSSLDWLIEGKRLLEEGQGSGSEPHNKKIRLNSPPSSKQKQVGKYRKRKKQVRTPAQREALRERRRQNWENLDDETKKIKNAANWQSELRRRARLSAEELQKYTEARSKYLSERNRGLPADERAQMLKRKRENYCKRRDEKRAKQAQHERAW